MLREIVTARRSSDGREQRWFQDEDMDLFVWFDDSGAVASFQLAYDKQRREKVLAWGAGRGFEHSAVDAGVRPGRHPASPIMVPDGAFPAERIAREFGERAAGIDPAVADFVAAQVDAFARSLVVAEEAAAPIAPTRRRVRWRWVAAATVVVLVALLLLGRR